MKFEEFRGINPVFSAKNLLDEEVLYMLRLDWILGLIALVVISIVLTLKDIQ